MFLNVFRSALLALLLLATQVAAQVQQQIDYETWETFASQAEAALDDRDTSSDQIESIRENATEWRAQFDEAQNINAPRIQTIKDQISSLGPEPAEGETEAEDVADRRAALNAQLSELQAPGIKATEAYSRAESIVTHADEIERAREAEELMSQTPSPLLPTSWVAAGKDVLGIGAGLTSEGQDAVSEARGFNGWTQLLLYLAAGAALIYGRRVVDNLPSMLGARATGDGRAVIAFIVSLGQIMVPMIGLFLIAYAVDSTGLVGDWLRPFLLGMPLAGLAFFIGLWLIRTLFASTPVAYDTLHMPQKSRTLARFYGTGLTIMLSLHVWLSHAALPLSGFVRRDGAPPQIPYEVSEAGAGVIHFIIMLGGAFFLFQLANILRRMTRYYGNEAAPYRAKILAGVGRLLRLIVVVSLVLVMIGFVNGGNALFWPAVKSLALIGLLILLQDFIADLYSLALRSKEGARDSLIPLLIGLLLIVASVPVFALIWGASLSDLLEARTRILNGVSFGSFSISPGAVLTLLIVFAIGYMITKWLQSVLGTQILPRTKLDRGAQSAAVSGLGYIGIFLAALLAITSAGFDLSSLAIVAGALSVGIGFGLQTIVQNFVSGIILLIERPISVGDWVEAGGQQGIVQEISVRSTRIKTFDQTDVIVPNSDLISQTVTNWTRGNARGRIIVPVGVAYGSDTRKVEQILREIAEDQPTVLIDPAPAILLMNFGADSLDFEVRCILSDISGGIGVASEMRHQIAQRFAAEGIEIPFAQRDLWLRNPETLFAKKGDSAEERPVQIEESVEDTDARPPQDIRSVGELPGDADGDGEY
ncbi:mechanosensitive ion channel family protein [Paracoccus albus]|uniref:mechanosensitive ion channel family protein n=1 Tax=Paracoccus albus TaxID=3017784 RepID=UPI0022F0A1EB|nr:DUF3772 domain-containing protein [Paracoccus albus]WBU61214.1 mechanosensitive ion channel [Paracoccus albus]